MKILVLGNAIVDVILNIKHLPQTGDDIYCQKQAVNIGGCAYNVATILKHFNVNHDLVVPIGEGSYATMIKQELIHEGYQLHIQDDRADNGYCLCLVEEGGERTFITVPGIEKDYKLEWLSQLDASNYEAVYLSGYEMEGKSGEIISQWLSEQSIPNIYFAPGPRITFIEEETMNKLLNLKPILHLNKSEALSFTQTTELLEAAQSLVERTQNEVFITLGEKGVLHYHEMADFIPSVPATVVNTIGAGDSHLGAILATRALGYDTLTCCEVANKVAAKVVSLKSSKLEKENFTENIAAYYYVPDKNIGRIVIEKSGDYYFYKIRETGTVERDYDIYQGDEVLDLYVNDNGFTEQEMDEWLAGLEYNETLDIGGVKGGYFCKYLVNTQTDSIEGDIGYIVAVDVSRALVNDTIQETGLTGYALIAGYDGKILESAKAIYSTNDCNTPELGQIERGWQGVTVIEAPADEKYHISLMVDELKPGIFAWMSWEYQK